MSTPHRKRARGRPSTGVADYRQVTLWLPPNQVDALDRLADRRQVATGKRCDRVALVREAIDAYLAREDA